MYVKVDITNTRLYSRFVVAQRMCNMLELRFGVIPGTHPKLRIIYCLQDNYKRSFFKMSKLF